MRASRTPSFDFTRGRGSRCSPFAVALRSWIISTGPLTSGWLRGLFSATSGREREVVTAGRPFMKR